MQKPTLYARQLPARWAFLRLQGPVAGRAESPTRHKRGGTLELRIRFDADVTVELHRRIGGKSTVATYEGRDIQQLIKVAAEGESFRLVVSGSATGTAELV